MLSDETPRGLRHLKAVNIFDYFAPPAHDVRYKPSLASNEALHGDI